MARSTDREIRIRGDKERAVKVQVEKLLDMSVKDETHLLAEDLHFLSAKCP